MTWNGWMGYLSLSSGASIKAMEHLIRNASDDVLQAFLQSRF